MKIPNIYCVILAGGKGERLWPYSKSSRPKHVIPFLGNESLVLQTIKRCKLITDNVWVVTCEQQRDLVCDLSRNLLQKIVVEPFTRNTAAAVLLTSFYLEQERPDALVAFLPADHYIPDMGIFAKKIQKVFSYIENCDSICLLGLKPLYSAVGYGYIEIDDYLRSRDRIVSVKRFHEKPNQEIVDQYVRDGNKFWNLGMFVGKVSTFINEYKFHASEIYENVLDFLKNGNRDSYKSLPNQSIDCALIEKSRKVVVLPVEFKWSDIGSLDEFLSIKQKQSNFRDVVQLDSKNNLVDVKDKLVALVGVEDICVVEQDDVLLIVKRKDVGRIRELVHLLKEQGRQEFC